MYNVLISAGITSLSVGIAHWFEHNLIQTEHARHLKISRYCCVHTSVTVRLLLLEHRGEHNQQPTW